MADNAERQRIRETAIQRIAELTERNQLSNAETHAIIHIMVDGTTTARRTSNANQTTDAALSTLQQLRAHGLIDSTTQAAPPNEKTPWYLTATGEAEASILLQPSLPDPDPAPVGERPQDDIVDMVAAALTDVITRGRTGR